MAEPSVRRNWEKLIKKITQEYDVEENNFEDVKSFNTTIEKSCLISECRNEKVLDEECKV